MSNTRLCRLCAQPQLHLLDVTSYNSDGALIADLIVQYLSIQVEIGGMFPAVVCYECNNQLLVFHRFVIQVRQGQVVLEKLCGIDPNSSVNSHFNYNLFSNNVKGETIKQESSDSFDFPACTSMVVEPVIEIKTPFELQDKKDTDFKQEICQGDVSSEEDKIKSKKKKKSKSPKDRKARESRRESRRESTRESTREYSMSSERKPNFKYYLNQKMEMAYSETVQQSFSCYMCKEEYPSNKELLMHQKSHLLSIDPIRPWPCPQCDKKFRNRASAVQHVRVAHEGSTEFMCHECGHTFGAFGDLKNHLTIHSDFFKYECEKCGKKFKKKALLTIHMDTHEGTVYNCPQCGLTLNSRRTLQNHMFTHDEIGREQCTICGKRFKTRKTLKAHILIHSGEHPYKCMWCPKSFADHSNLRNHKKKVHTVELMMYEAQKQVQNGNGERLHQTNIRMPAHIMAPNAIPPHISLTQSVPTPSSVEAPLSIASSVAEDASMTT